MTEQVITSAEQGLPNAECSGFTNQRQMLPLCSTSGKWRGIDNHCFPNSGKENACLSILLDTLHYTVSITHCWQWLFNISTLIRWNKKQVRVHFYSPDVYCGISVSESKRPLSFIIIYVRLRSFFALTIHLFSHLLTLYRICGTILSISKPSLVTQKSSFITEATQKRNQTPLTEKKQTANLQRDILPFCCISHTNITSFCYLYLLSPSTTKQSDLSRVTSANIQVSCRNWLFIHTTAQPLMFYTFIPHASFNLNSPHKLYSSLLLWGSLWARPKSGFNTSITDGYTISYLVRKVLISPKRKPLFSVTINSLFSLLSIPVYNKWLF